MARETINGISVPIPGTGEPADFVSDLRRIATDLSASTVTKVKDVSGGAFPTPVRVPVLITKATWPTPRDPYQLAWSEGDTRYAFGRDNTLRKSTDKGATWTKLGYNSFGFGTNGCFLKLASGTLLNIHAVSGAHVQRSTDDGVSWTNVYDFRTNTIPLTSQSWCVDGDGTIWIGEYNTTDQTEVRLIRSTDDGATWSTFYTWNGAAVGGTGYIRHIHAVQWDPIDERVIICTGDSTDFTGLWRVNAAGTSVEKILTNDMLAPGDIDIPRSIGVMPFDNYLAWAGDTTLQPYLFRIDRAEIGDPSPTVERIYRLNSAAYSTCRASDDNSRWVVCGSQESASNLDGLVHLYAVEDDGETVWEVGAVAVSSPGSAALMPVGRPEMHDHVFVMGSRNTLPMAQWRFEIGEGNVANIDPPRLIPDCPVTFSAQGPTLTLTPLQEVVFGHSVAGGLGRKLHIFEAGVHTIDLGGGSAGSQRIRVRKAGSAHVLEYLNISERYTGRLEGGGAIATHTFTSGDTVEFYVRNNSTTATTIVVPSITYGWSNV